MATTEEAATSDAESVARCSAAANSRGTEAGGVLHRDAVALSDLAQVPQPPLGALGPPRSLGLLLRGDLRRLLRHQRSGDAPAGVPVPAGLGEARSFRLFDQAGNFRPAIYPVRTKLNETFEQDMTWRTNGRCGCSPRATPIPCFFIDSDIHLFGSGDPGVRWFPLGTDGMAAASTRAWLRRHLVAVDRDPDRHLGAGLLIGGVSGYFGGIVDNVIQRSSRCRCRFRPCRCGSRCPRRSLHMAGDRSTPAITVILSLLGWTGLARVSAQQAAGPARGGVRAGGHPGRLPAPAAVARHMLRRSPATWRGHPARCRGMRAMQLSGMPP